MSPLFHNQRSFWNGKLFIAHDEGKIAFTIAVELSYLKEEEQYELHAVMELEQCTPSLSQANRLKRMSQ